MEKRILESELEDLQFDLLRMSSLVEKAVFEATKSLLDDQINLAYQVIAEDDSIDRLNIEVQDKCLRLLALRQPLAVDLRAIQTDLQIATDLERMGDYAESIARSTIRLHDRRTITKLTYLPQMAEMVREMVHDIITAYILADIQMARNCVILEKEIDTLYREYYGVIMKIIKEDANRAEMAVQLLFAAQFLERIADHATNIGESILYMVTGLRASLND
ncbi:MAG: phosphate signaling complex protein PhoU [Firmicutes bacterium]|nr:phosphate signaling complex protein PhoU [Bacillota bacterium]